MPYYYMGTRAPLALYSTPAHSLGLVYKYIIMIYLLLYSRRNSSGRRNYLLQNGDAAIGAP